MVPRPPCCPLRGPRARTGLALLGIGLGACALAQGIAVQGAAAQGAPRSVGECERLKNDLAYNQCLAMFGPAAKNVAGGYASEQASAAPASALPLAAQAASLPQADEAQEEARPGRRGRYRVRRGRQSAVFTAGSSDGQSYRRRRRR